MPLRPARGAGLIRKVPVHDTLIKVGFKEYLEGINESLFPRLVPQGPDGKKSWYLSKKFHTYRTNLGVTRDKVSFHSFRKNFVTALEQANTPHNKIAQIIGHEKGFTYDTYSAGLTVSQLKPVVDLVVYDGLNLNHLYAEQP